MGKECLEMKVMQTENMKNQERDEPCSKDMIDSKESADRNISELALLFAISKELSDALDLRSVMQPVLKMIAEKLGVVRGAITILNRTSSEIVIEESYGLIPEEKAKGRYMQGEGVTGKVVETGQPCIVPRISEEPMFLDRTGSRKNLDDNDISFICVPIKIGAEVIGTLSVDRVFDPHNSLDEDLRLLTIIASCLSQAVRLRQLAKEEVEEVIEENERLHEELKYRYAPKNIIGSSKRMRGMYALIDKVSGTNTSVLILGESGVGKEMVARAVHFGSNRADKPFIKFNCAALPETLIESELFGHEKGAFTGANAMRKGRFEFADTGTVFLDEIGELTLPVQAKLLRVIQEKEFERIGSSETIHVDVRIIAATNRNLEDLMAQGKFREDLYYRLNVFPIMVAPLRERKTDIMLLADYFIAKFNKEHSKNITRISTPSIDMMMAYHWPGNVRELENCIERAVILSTDGAIHSYHLPPSLQTVASSGTDIEGTLETAISSVEKEMIVEELKRSRGNMAKSARNLGITERIMSLRVEKYGIDAKRFK
jgi:Nif-specific regulatory protein